MNLKRFSRGHFLYITLGLLVLLVLSGSFLGDGEFHGTGGGWRVEAPRVTGALELVVVRVTNPVDRALDAAPDLDRVGSTHSVTAAPVCSTKPDTGSVRAMKGVASRFK